MGLLEYVALTNEGDALVIWAVIVGFMSPFIWAFSRSQRKWVANRKFIFLALALSSAAVYPSAYFYMYVKTDYEFKQQVKADKELSANIDKFNAKLSRHVDSPLKKDGCGIGTPPKELQLSYGSTPKNCKQRLESFEKGLEIRLR